jgi:lysine 2,3-aminomutase
MKASELQTGVAVTVADNTPVVDEKDEPPGLSILSIPTKKQSQGAMIISDRSRSFLQRFFPNATETDWNSWQWQVRNSFTRLSQLSDFLSMKGNEVRPDPGVNDSLPIRITPYYASLLTGTGDTRAIKKAVVPVIDEFIMSASETSDPLAEGHDSPVPNLVHRYPDRALLLVTGFCATYCRYCTRSHMVAKDKCHTGKKVWSLALDYIRNHPEIRDVIVSGGDPLTMSDAQIGYLLSELQNIPHVEIIRIGTKVPVVLPQRINKSLLSVLKRYQPIYMSIHFTHPDELTPEVQMACNMLADAGIPLGSQTVLLKDINDDVATMRKLMQGLLRVRVRPYYLYQCDPIPGSGHFRTPVSKGLEIIEGLRGHTSGYAVPHYVIDAPGGGGKIPLLPDYYQGTEGNTILLRNYLGKYFFYPDAV